MADKYDAKKFYEDNLDPLVRQIKVLCIANKIPMFMTFAIKNNDKETVYKSDMVLAAAQKMLTENRIGLLLFQLRDADMNETPEWVLRDIAELEEYLSTIKTDGEDKVDVELKKDILYDMNEITNKGGKKSGKK